MSFVLPPRASIKAITQEHGVEENSRLGVRFTVETNTWGANGSPCVLAVFFADESGQAVKPLDSDYANPWGETWALGRYTPTSDEHPQAIPVFLPYQAILPPGSGPLGVRVLANIWCDAVKRYIAYPPMRTYMAVRGSGTEADLDKVLARVANALFVETQEELRHVYIATLQMIYSMPIRSDIERQVHDTLILIAKNIYPRDPVTNRPLP